MVARRKTKGARTATTSSRTDSALYLGCFFFDDWGEQELTGTFQMVIDASSPEHAVKRFRARLREIKRSGDLFDSPTTIYLEGFIPLTGSFKNGLLVNWESHPKPEAEYQLTNFVPNQGVAGAGGYHLKDGDDGKIEPFIDFGGQAAARLEAAKERAAKGSTAANVPNASRPEDKAKAKAEAMALRAQRAAEREARRKAQLAAKEAKVRRQRALEATLGEMKDRGRPRSGK